MNRNRSSAVKGRTDDIFLKSDMYVVGIGGGEVKVSGANICMFFAACYIICAGLCDRLLFSFFFLPSLTFLSLPTHERKRRRKKKKKKKELERCNDNHIGSRFSSKRWATQKLRIDTPELLSCRDDKLAVGNLDLCFPAGRYGFIPLFRFGWTISCLSSPVCPSSFVIAVIMVIIAMMVITR